jgi:hypothetical protein
LNAREIFTAFPPIFNLDSAGNNRAVEVWAVRQRRPTKTW